MIFAALTLLAAFCGLFAWIAVMALQTNTLHGAGWSATKAGKPLRYWVGVAVYLLNLAAGSMFFLIILGTTKGP